MLFSTLQIEDRLYALDALPEIESPLTFSNKTIAFCKKWMEGQSTFEIPTSGSTGIPKKIILQRKSIVTSAMATAAAIGLQQGQTALVCLAPDYIAGMMMLVRSLEVKINIIAVPPSNNPFDAIDPKAKIDFTALVPYQVKSILKSAQREYFNQLKTVLIGGASLDSATKKELQNFTCQIYETYGMTETISHVALKKINSKDSSDYFQTLPGIRIQLDDRGCLCITASYLTDEILTNDVVELKDKNQFLWKGRWDNVINSGGVKIFPETLEQKIDSVFNSLQLTNRFFIAPLPDPMWGQSVNLFVEGTLLVHQSERLNDQLKEKLEKFEFPKAIKFIPLFAKTETGKINRKKTVSDFYLLNPNS